MRLYELGDIRGELVRPGRVRARGDYVCRVEYTLESGLPPLGEVVRIVIGIAKFVRIVID